MRPRGFEAPHLRPSSNAAPDHGQQDARPGQAGHGLPPTSGSIGSAVPAQNGWTSQVPGYAGRPATPPAPGAQRLPPGNVAGGFNNLSLNGAPPQLTQHYSKAPIGGGEYVQQQARQQQPPGPAPLPQSATGRHPPPTPSRPGFGLRGPPAFGKSAPGAPLAGPRLSAAGSAGRPASPSSPNKYASIPMPASPSPTHSKQQAAQMPLPPNQPRSLAPPSFNTSQQVLSAQMQTSSGQQTQHQSCCSAMHHSIMQ